MCQVDRDKPRNYLWFYYKKAPSPPLPRFLKGRGNAPVIPPSAGSLAAVITPTLLILPSTHPQTVIGCLHPTPTDNLLILAGILSAELRRKGATLPLARRAMESGHLLHSALTYPSGGNARHLKSRHPFVPAAQQLISSSDNNRRWRSGWMTDGMQSDRRALRDTCFHPRHRHPSSWNGPAKISIGMD